MWVPSLTDTVGIQKVDKNYLRMKRGIIFLMILALSLTCNLFAQKPANKYYITGQVVDMNDKPVPDAIILIDYKNTGVVTDKKGMFKVKVKKDAAKIGVLQMTIGQSEEDINGRTVVNFRLGGETPTQTTNKPENSGDEKVNTGYGSTAKKDLTTSVTQIGNQNSGNATYQNIYEMLRVDPSVQVNGKKITIRGISTINSTDPLLIVNDIPVSSIDDISPRMVKSITILKGSDASIYGARGANGVIMITLIGSGK